MNTFKDFLTKAKHVSIPKDFDANNAILQDIDILLYDDFLALLKLGVEIIPAKVGLYEIKKMSIETKNTPSELIRLITWARKIHYIIDESKYR